MKAFKVAFSFLIVAAFTACSGAGKKVLIMASGKITVDKTEQKNIKLEPGNTHTEKELILTGDKETLTVQNGGSSKTYEVNEPGNYVLNLKPDTLVGGQVKYGTGNRTSNLTGEDVDLIIDSTQKLIAGQNASDETKTYFILPFTLKKISANSESRIVGPYNGIPGSVDAGSSGKAPELYKLFTNKQKREALNALINERKK
ncbi:MAG: hypothetical protein ABIN89_21150 [Chitinophagaceae bacterium]